MVLSSLRRSSPSGRDARSQPTAPPLQRPRLRPPLLREGLLPGPLPLLEECMNELATRTPVELELPVSARERAEWAWWERMDE